MTNGLYDLARQNSWATTQLLPFCQRLNGSPVDAIAPGTYGTVIQTLQHVIVSEASYLYRLTGAWPTHPWLGDAAVGIDNLIERTAVVATVLEQFVATDCDTERLGEARGDDGVVFAVRARVYAPGYETPDLSGWDYALATGRMTEKSV
jgi:uncharacterized damage-inducible protein DinB